MPEISAAIISHNEENHIVRTLAALKGAVDEIVVVLNQDTNEQTEHICRSHGARVFRNPFVGYGQQKQFATACAMHNLILSIDADEAPDDVLINELNAIRKGLLTADAYSVGIKNFYCGKWMRFGGINSSKRIRLFNRNKGSWDNPPVHEKIIMHNGATIFHLKGNILHIAYESREEHLRKLKDMQGLVQKSMLVNLFGLCC
ncbi:MAG: glycosyltransferase family 2 protein [Chitinophagales bacterium]|nr:glycosyltransferase family 2 protein [Chitinophagales bacterium]